MGNAYLATQLAQEIGKRANEAFPDFVTFQRATRTADDSGGTLATQANTTPASVPCRYRPSSGSEIEQAGKSISGTAYTFFIPSHFSSALVDVDAKCRAVVAARSGGEPSRTFNVQWVGRVEGIVIHLLASLEG